MKVKQARVWLLLCLVLNKLCNVNGGVGDNDPDHEVDANVFESDDPLTFVLLAQIVHAGEDSDRYYNISSQKSPSNLPHPPFGLQNLEVYLVVPDTVGLCERVHLIILALKLFIVLGHQ